MIKCCQYCVPPKRHFNCWSSCPDYIAEKEKDAKDKAEWEKAHLAETYRYAMLKQHHNYIIETRHTKHGYSFRNVKK